MKIAAIACFCLMSATALAQETTEASPEPVSKPLFQRKNEIGLMAETGFNNYPYSGNIDFRGLQYKRWVKPNMGYRIIAAYGEYYETNKPIISGKFGDTVVDISKHTTVPNAILGVGVDMQRKFYKHIYLYASVELRGVYGKGHYNYVTSEYVENNPNVQYNNATRSTNNDATIFAISATPSIGAKIQFNRLGFGTELSAAQVGYSSIKYTNAAATENNEGLMEFNMGTFRQRFFVYYRF